MMGSAADSVTENSVTSDCEIFSPNVGTDQGEVGPFDPKALGKLVLKRAKGALSCGRRAFDIHDHGPGLDR